MESRGKTATATVECDHQRIDATTSLEGLRLWRDDMKLPFKARTPKKLAIRLLKRTKVLTRDGRWTQRTYARDKHGKPTGTFTMAACQWCVTAALLKSRAEASCRYGPKFTTIAWRIADSGMFNHVGVVSRFNDSCRTVEEMHAAIDEVIVSLKREIR